MTRPGTAGHRHIPHRRRAEESRDTEPVRSSAPCPRYIFRRVRSRAGAGGRTRDSGFTRTQMLIVVTVTIVRVGAGDRTIPCPRQNALCRVCVPVSCRLISILIWRQVEVKYAQLFTVSKICIFKHLFQHIRSLLYFLPGCQPMFLLVPSIGSDRIPNMF